MSIGGTCHDNGYVGFVRSGIARKEHICSECREKIKIGEPFAWSVWGQFGEGGGSARRCQFCASFAAEYPCIDWGKLRPAIMAASYKDIINLPDLTRNELLRKFKLTLEYFKP